MASTQLEGQVSDGMLKIALVHREGSMEMRIGELARTTGFSTKTIRYYEAVGVLPAPRRSASGYRLYGGGGRDRLEFVRKAKRLGLSLEEIKGILQVHDRDRATCEHVRRLVDQKLEEVDQLVEDLQAFRAELRVLRDETASSSDCRPDGGRICVFIENSVFDANRPPVPPFRRSRYQHSQSVRS